ncbi:MAG: ABC transporter ATP-binding protein [Bdellovibrionota bacterium]
MSFDGRLRSINKSFGLVKANEDLNLHVRAGTIHALVGENGAGKSTAMKILFGMVKPDSGQVIYGQTDVTSAWNPHKAAEHGIGMVHQHFMLALTEKVHDNLVLGFETTKLGFRQRKKERKALEELIETTGLKVPLDARVEDLPVGLQSRCEILKVLYRKARFLILDEPTAVLTPQETEDFLKTLHLLKSRGNTLLIVTHKLKEVMKIADDITVMRAGTTVATRKAKDTDVEELSELMVGRKVCLPRTISKKNSATERPLFELKTSAFHIAIQPGEIVGIGGVEGNGQDSILEALLDPRKLEAERFTILKENVLQYKTAQIRRLPLGIVPPDRHENGLNLSMSLTENLRLGREQCGRAGHAYFGSITASETSLLQEFDVKPPRPSLAASALSGGNQQKLVLARELGQLPNQSVLIAYHPTRGVDVGSIEFIHEKILAAAARDSAILLISSELDELMALSHRIAVFYRGTIARWFHGPHYDEKDIGLAMLTGGLGEKKEARL